MRRDEKIVANYPMEKFSPFDYESFEFGGIVYSTKVRQGEFVEEAFERAQKAVTEFAVAQFNIKRQMFLDHRKMAHSPELIPALDSAPIIFTPSPDEAEDDAYQVDEDEDNAFRPKATDDAGDKLTLCYGVEKIATIKFKSLEIGGQFYTTTVRRREVVADAYQRAWLVLSQVAHRQFIVKCKGFHAAQQAQAALQLTDSALLQRYGKR
ncbi:MAG: hypothetical protein ACKO0Z_12510 [Betaproteobacteria bacterium]